MATDHYETLGVARGATKDEIKRAYRKLAHQHHPDKGGGDEEKFKKVNEAYQVLGDDAKRAQYDQFGSAFEGGGSAGGQSGFGGFDVNFEDLGGLNDIFEQFFGGRGQRGGQQRTRRGQDVAIDVSISFIESAQALRREVTMQLHQTCSHCKGNGAEPNTPIVTCPDCNGAGYKQTARQTMFGTFAQNTVCPTCQGEGKQAKTPCKECRGQGRVNKRTHLDIEIPAGIADGQTIRITGKGEAPPRGGMPGDLYVTVHVEPHRSLRREGDSVQTTVTIPFVDAALGTQVTVDTLQGANVVDIPAGTQPNARVTLKGKGFPSLRGGRQGDEVVTVQIEIPKKLNKQQRKLLEEFKAAKKKSFF